MYIETHRDGTNVVMMVKGRIDGNSAPMFHEEFKSAIAETDRIVVLDCQDLSFITSAGLRVMLLMSKDTSRLGARLAVCSLSYEVKQVFVMSGFQKVIPIHVSRTDALQAAETKDPQSH